MQVRGHIKMPKILADFLATVGEADTEKTPVLEDVDTNTTSYFQGRIRKIDIMLLCSLYGLYRAREIPSADDLDESILDGSYEFTARIDRATEVFQNALTLLWVKSNKKPKSKDSREYRRELSEAVERIINPEYLTNVAIPYFLMKASEGDGGKSFIEKLAASSFVEWKMRSQAPEHVALEFVRKRREFEKYLEKGLSSLQPTGK